MGECLRSGNCCTNFGVCVTPFDISRIAAGTGLQPVDFVMAIPEPPNRERAEPAVLIDGVPCLIVLRWQTKRVCKFYGPNGCTIYSARPNLCRTYPFAFSENRELIEVTARACPARWMPDDLALDQYLVDLAEYKKDVLTYKEIAKKWNILASRKPPQKTGLRGTSLPDFLEFISSQLFR